MKILLLAGGVGKRLWPLSNHVRSKQFLKLLRNDHDQLESTIQRICRQLDSLGLLDSTSIITCQDQVEIIRNQIGDDVQLICEPYQKGTFASIALASTFLHSKFLIEPDETICVLPADCFADASFFQLINLFPNCLRLSRAKLSLIGVPPTFPSNQFGYIVPNMNQPAQYYPIEQFIEKPDPTLAQTLINKQALWNCGVFAFPLTFILEYLKDKGMSVDYQQLLASYQQLPTISFDHEVVEKTSDTVVIPFYGLWKDLGSWSSITEQLDLNIMGKGNLSTDSTNVHIVNELSLPIHVIGLSNSIIAASPDGILIADKKQSHRIKEMTKDELPMYVEKRWGIYQILYQKRTEQGEESLTKLIKVESGRNMSYHSHCWRKEIWTVLSGCGEFILDDQLFLIHSGDVLKIPVGAKHGVKAIAPLELIEVQIGSNLDENDIICYADSWEEVRKRSR